MESTAHYILLIDFQEAVTQLHVDSYLFAVVFHEPAAPVFVISHCQLCSFHKAVGCLSSMGLLLIYNTHIKLEIL